MNLSRFLWLDIWPHILSTAGRLDDFYIEVSNNSNGNSAQQCAEESEQFTGAETRVYACPSGVRGRYVRIRFDESKDGILQLCEVQVQSGKFQLFNIIPIPYPFNYLLINYLTTCDKS